MNTSSISGNESLLRFIVFSRWIHKRDNTPKQDAFMPDLYKRGYGVSLETSVTRGISLPIDEIWRIGRNVAMRRGRTLHGRVDIGASAIKPPISVIPDPVPDNHNHAVIIDWPSLDKDAQKQIALDLAQKATPLIVP